jgi:sugar (pentulose or hexulose) kinase
LRETEPQLFSAGWSIGTPQSDVLARLGAAGQFVDLSVAAHTGLLDVAIGKWSETLLAAFDIPPDAVPSLVAPGAQVGVLDPRAAARFGLRSRIPLIAAGSDGVCAELGAGVVEPGQLYAYLGTAAAIACPLKEPHLPTDPALILMPGSTMDRWRILGLTMAGASARAWFMACHGIRSHSRLDRLISASPPGARGALFVPTLAGASAPVPDSRARGVFAGLSLAVGAPDLARAVHEGVALELRWLVQAMRDVIPAPTEVRLTGGGSRSNGWSAILADVLGIPVARVAEPNPGLRGAAVFAWSALGRFTSVLEAARSLEAPADLFAPRSRHGTLYDQAAEVYALIRTAFHQGGVDERLFRPSLPAPDMRA